MRLGEVNTQIHELIFVIQDVLCTALFSSFLSNLFKIFQLLACI